MPRPRPKPALVRAADLIGQLADPAYLRKLAALYFELHEIGIAEKMGCQDPADLAEQYPRFFWTRVEPYVGPALALPGKDRPGPPLGRPALCPRLRRGARPRPAGPGARARAVSRASNRPTFHGATDQKGSRSNDVDGTAPSRCIGQPGGEALIPLPWASLAPEPNGRAHVHGRGAATQRRRADLPATSRGSRHNRDHARLQPHRPGITPAALDWRAALVTGLITSTFSTFVAQLTAARVAATPWWTGWWWVRLIPLRDLALQAEPTWPFVVAGILFHHGRTFLGARVLRAAGPLDEQAGALGHLGRRRALGGVHLGDRVAVPRSPRAVLATAVPPRAALLAGPGGASGLIVAVPPLPLATGPVGRTSSSPNRGFARAWAGLALAGTLVLALHRPLRLPGP